LSVLVLCLGGCSWSLFGERDIADMPGVSAPNPDTDNPEGTPKPRPFPWGWTLGILTVGSLAAGAMMLKAPTLVDEVIVVTVGGIAVVVGLEMIREIWEMKWLLIGTVATIAAGLAAWKVSRRLWLPDSPASASPSSSPAAKSSDPIRGVMVSPERNKEIKDETIRESINLANSYRGSEEEA
jgi:hypothetical protein